MNIGIIVYSHTGHTLEAATLLAGKMEAAGQKTAIEQITISGEAAPGKFTITASPETGIYDALVFASPVQAFSLNPVMRQYLESLPTLEGKKVALLATKQLPFFWTGGNRAISTMAQICWNKGAEIIGSSIVIWSGARKEKTLNEAVPRLADILSKI